MRCLAVLLATLGGCFAPEPPSGVLCSTQRTCPDGLACYGERCFRSAPFDAMVDAPLDAAFDAMVDAPGDAPRCAGFAALPGLTTTHTFRVEITAMPWEAARQECMDAGGYLAIPDSTDEAAALVLATGDQNTWFGISDVVTEGTWVTVNGGTSFFEMWATGEPNNGGDPMNDPGQDCGQGYLGGGYFDDEDCLKVKPFVCECEP